MGAAVFFWAIATDCNSMRRDMTSSLRACLAAESWKRLYPDGNAPGQGRKKVGSAQMELTHKSWANYREFAAACFKSPANSSEQALAILNHSPELLEDAKQGLA